MPERENRVLTGRIPTAYGRCTVTPNEAVQVAAQNGLVLHTVPFVPILVTEDGRRVVWTPGSRQDVSEDGLTCGVTITFTIEGR